MNIKQTVEFDRRVAMLEDQLNQLGQQIIELTDVVERLEQQTTHDPQPAPPQASQPKATHILGRR